MSFTFSSPYVMALIFVYYQPKSFSFICSISKYNKQVTTEFSLNMKKNESNVIFISIYLLYFYIHLLYHYVLNYIIYNQSEKNIINKLEVAIQLKMSFYFCRKSFPQSIPKITLIHSWQRLKLKILFLDEKLISMTLKVAEKIIKWTFSSFFFINSKNKNCFRLLLFRK